MDNDRLFLSVVTIGEIQRGVSNFPPSRRQDDLTDWLQNALLVRFQDRVLPLNTNVMLTWGKLTAQGRTLSAIDSLIAALALHHGLCLVTRNVKDFSSIDLKIFNPWDSA